MPPDKSPPAVGVVDAAAVAAALPFRHLVPALAALFAAGCEAPPRGVHVVSAAAADPVTSLVMPAWVPGRFYGVKVVNVAPGNAVRGLPALHASYLLHDAATGRPLAWIDGGELTARRTAATSALAASWLARPDARRLLVVGAGRIARLLPVAYDAVRPGLRLAVWARRREQAESLAAAWRAEGRDAEVRPDLATAVADADIVSCATLATSPLVEGRWLAPGSHLDLIGSFTPAMREADDACFAGASVWIDGEDAPSKSGDLIGPIERGLLTPEAIGTLTQLARGEAPGRRRRAERTVFKSVGSALEDLAAAMAVWAALSPDPCRGGASPPPSAARP